MKKIFMMGCVAAAMLAGMSSCEEPETGYEGINYIYLESDASYLYDMEGETLDVTVRLTTALEQDLTLTFKTDDTENLITLEGNPVTITAGATTATFTIVPGTLSIESKSYKVSLDQEATVLPENVQWAEDFTFTVNSSVTAPLTDEQLAIIDAYKESTGIDLSKYIGLVNVSTVYTASNPDVETSQPPVTRKGYTMITLSEQSTAEIPVLKMTNNAMGLQDFLYDRLKTYTLENPSWEEPEDDGSEEENPAKSYSMLLSAIGWTTTSAESFIVSLDEISLGTEIEFAKDVDLIDEYGDPVTQFKVPLEFYFSAYEREKEAVAEKIIGEEAYPGWWMSDATVNPDSQLNCDDTSEDWPELGNWTEPSASISAEKLEFTFCLYNYNDYDYSKVTATYTPNE